MRRNLTTFGILLFALTAVRLDAAVQLRLRVEPQAQLPGIEPSLRVEAINTGSEPAELPRTVALQVTPPGDRKPFVAYTAMRGSDRVTWFYTGDEAASIVLAPNETRDFSFWAGSPVWFAGDSRLLSPGTYRFQLVAHPKLDSDLLERVDRAVDQPGMVDPIVSNEAVYIVETPKGEDAVVWEWIKQLPSPMFWSDALDRRIWAEHPNSRYAAYCLKDPKADDPAVSIAAYAAALEKQPSRSWADWFRFGIGWREVDRAGKFIFNRDVEGAFEAMNRARTILAELAKEGANPDLRRRAKQLLDGRLMTREELVRHIKSLNGDLRETQPHALCVEKLAGGKHVFWFGYENYTLEPMKIPIGPENRFTPPPFDRGQPTSFPPHRTVLGVRVETTEPAVTWHLQHYNEHASLAKTPACPADMHERFPYKPPQRD